MNKIRSTDNMKACYECVNTDGRNIKHYQFGKETIQTELHVTFIVQQFQSYIYVKEKQIYIFKKSCRQQYSLKDTYFVYLSTCMLHFNRLF